MLLTNALVSALLSSKSQRPKFTMLTVNYMYFFQREITFKTSCMFPLVIKRLTLKGKNLSFNSMKRNSK